MRQLCTLVLAAALTSIATPASAGDKAALEVIGFDTGARRFAYWTYGEEDGSGFSWAELVVTDVKSGKRIAAESKLLRLERGGETAALEELKGTMAARLGEGGFGKDRGVELYRSGTSTRTSFTVEGTAYTLRLVTKVISRDENPKDRVTVRLESRRGGRTLYSGSAGFEYSLNSVRLSADGRSLAVFLKHSTRGFEGANRRYLLTTARLAP